MSRDKPSFAVKIAASRALPSVNVSDPRARNACRKARLVSLYWPLAGSDSSRSMVDVVVGGLELVLRDELFGYGRRDGSGNVLKRDFNFNLTCSQNPQN